MNIPLWAKRSCVYIYLSVMKFDHNYLKTGQKDCTEKKSDILVNKSCLIRALSNLLFYTEKDDFDQQTASKAAVGWPKYTTRVWNLPHKFYPYLISDSVLLTVISYTLKNETNREALNFFIMLALFLLFFPLVMKRVLKHRKIWFWWENSM